MCVCGVFRVCVSMLVVLLLLLVVCMRVCGFLFRFNFSLVNYRHPPVVRHRHPGYRTSTASGCLAAAA